MDSFTQAILGASIGTAFFGNKAVKKGVIAGAAIATIPDLDVIILPFFSDLERISIHRGFSHSIVFTILAALILSYILSRMKWFKEISILKIFLFTWSALFTHILLDAFTTYGTQLFLPFSDIRVSLDSINVVDPVYTIWLILGVGITLFFKKAKGKKSIYNTLGLIISSAYLLFTLAFKTVIQDKFISNLNEQNIPSNTIITSPVGMGSINWYGASKTEDGFFLGKYSVIDNNKISFNFFPANDHLLDEVDLELSKTMKWFAKDFYSIEEVDGKIRFYNLQVDMQGVRQDENYLAPTAWYFEITPLGDGGYILSSAMHEKSK